MFKYLIYIAIFLLIFYIVAYMLSLFYANKMKSYNGLYFTDAQKHHLINEYSKSLNVNVITGTHD